MVFATNLFIFILLENLFAQFLSYNRKIKNKQLLQDIAIFKKRENGIDEIRKWIKKR
jgi:hypothetical protein